MKKLLLTSTLMALAGCSASLPPAQEDARRSIDRALQSASNSALPAAAASAPTALPRTLRESLLPPLRPNLPQPARERLDPRFDLVVKEAPIQQVLSAIVMDTGYSILLRPRAPGGGTAALAETVTVNLKNVTVFEALNAMRELLGYEYTLDGTHIFVQPPELSTRLFQVNYVLGQRRGVSDLQVVAGASGEGYASTQASAVSSFSKTDLWGELEDSLRTVLGCTVPAAGSGAMASSVSEQGGGSSSRSSSGSSSGSGGGGSNRADASFPGEMQLGTRQRGNEGCPDGRSLSLNAMSGVLMVRAMPSELRMVQQLLRSVQRNVERQVIIEAKIIDVELNADAQQGINWAGFKDGLHRFSVGAETSLIGSAALGGGALNPGSIGALLGGGLTGGTGGAFSSGLGMALQLNNFSALINFLQTQGQVHVLSSPRIATLNNQKAVLKVGSEESFVTNITGGSVTTTNGVTNSSPPTLSYQPFFSGIALDVTPQIDDTGNITLHVHSLINTITEKPKISAPTAGGVLVPFAVNSINETDSVIRTRDNQVVVIGGLMTESSQDSRSRVPGAGDAQLVGGLFRKDSQRSVKRELVILLKPTVVQDERQWQNDIAASRERIESMGGEVLRLPASKP
jgi:MSHA biogenesis protein MshL